jgi:hypothetical protein
MCAAFRLTALTAMRLKPRRLVTEESRGTARFSGQRVTAMIT